MIDLYHNPRCSKSRAVLVLLESRSEQVRIIDYLKLPPDAKTLQSILTLLTLTPMALMRKNEAVFKSLKLAERKLSDEQLISIMIEHPILIERPIVVANNKAVIGRPPEAVLSIL